MTAGRVIEILRYSGAILEGHFQLVSGLHSNVYFQMARLFSRPDDTIEIAGLMSDPFRDDQIDLVVGMEPAGSVLAFEVGRSLRTAVIIGRRDGQGIRMFGRLEVSGSKVLIVDDVLTTGGTITLMRTWVEQGGGLVVGVTLVLSKGLAKTRLADKQSILAEHPDVPVYKPDECPLCRVGTPLSIM